MTLNNQDQGSKDRGIPGDDFQNIESSEQQSGNRPGADSQDSPPEQKQEPDDEQGLSKGPPGSESGVESEALESEVPWLRRLRRLFRQPEESLFIPANLIANSVALMVT